MHVIPLDQDAVGEANRQKMLLREVALGADKPSSLARDAEFLPEFSLPHAFAVISGRVSALLQKMYAEQFGLSVIGWRLMAILGRHSPMSAKALAETVALDPVTVSRTIDLLVNKRFVSRRTDPADRRRVVLRLSKKGEDVYSRVVPVLAAADGALVADLSDQEAQQLRELMARLLTRSSIDFVEGSNWEKSVIQAPQTVQSAADEVSSEG